MTVFGGAGRALIGWPWLLVVGLLVMGQLVMGLMVEGMVKVMVFGAMRWRTGIGRRDDFEFGVIDSFGSRFSVELASVDRLGRVTDARDVALGAAGGSVQKQAIEGTSNRAGGCGQRMVIVIEVGLQFALERVFGIDVVVDAETHLSRHCFQCHRRQTERVHLVHRGVYRTDTADSQWLKRQQ